MPHFVTRTNYFFPHMMVNIIYVFGDLYAHMYDDKKRSLQLHPQVQAAGLSLWPLRAQPTHGLSRVVMRPPARDNAALWRGSGPHRIWFICLFILVLPVHFRHFKRGCFLFRSPFQRIRRPSPRPRPSQVTGSCPQSSCNPRQRGLRDWDRPN